MMEGEESSQVFLRFAAEYSHLCRSQLGQDLWVLFQVGDSSPHYFVDIGAYDGISISNTYLLEKLGWSGLAIEPNPHAFAELRKNRICQLSDSAVTPSDQNQVEFNMVAHEPKLSRLSRIVPDDSHERNGARSEFHTLLVQGRCLTSIFEEFRVPPDLTYVSIDVEGAELAILQTFPFAKFRPKLFTVEHNYSDAREVVFGLLRDHGYQRTNEDISEFEDWYVRADVRAASHVLYDFATPLAQHLAAVNDLRPSPERTPIAARLRRMKGAGRTPGSPAQRNADSLSKSEKEKNMTKSKRTDHAALVAAAKARVELAKETFEKLHVDCGSFNEQIRGLVAAKAAYAEVEAVRAKRDLTIGIREFLRQTYADATKKLSDARAAAKVAKAK